MPTDKNASAHTSASHDGSALESEWEDDYDADDYDPADSDCHECGGDGWVMGCELGDPFWYDDDEAYRCPCCGGSGLAKDCTYW